MEVWIYNGQILTMVPGESVIEDGVVRVVDGRIAQVGTPLDFGADFRPALDGGRDDGQRTWVDARGGIIMPGLINGHTHVPMTMFRGMADDLPLETWLNEHIFPAEAQKVTPESVDQWAAHAAREMLLAGITTCCDGYFYEDIVAGALAGEGMRTVAGQGVIDFPAPGVADPSQNLALAREGVAKMGEISSLVVPSVFCHSPYTCSSATLQGAKALAREAGVLFQIHVAETRGEAGMIAELGDRSIVGYLDDFGILDEDTLLIHGVWLDEAQIEIIARRGGGVVHCPESNMKLASGIAPVPAMLDAGIPVGLGTDGAASNNDLDIFSEMDTAAKLHKVASLDPCVMDAPTVLNMATTMGAKALGLDGEIGSLAVGKRADIICVDTDQPHMVPLFDPHSALVYAARPSDVSMVMVDGNIRVSKRKPPVC